MEGRKLSMVDCNVRIAILNKTLALFGFYPVSRIYKYINMSCPMRYHKLVNDTTLNAEWIELEVNGIIISLISRCNRFLLSGMYGDYNELCVESVKRPNRRGGER